MSKTRAMTTDAVSSAAIVSVVVVVAMWISNRGIQDLSSDLWGGAVSLARVAGLVSADLMLIQVLLMARIPWVERGYGQDRLARWHRILGFVSFSLLLAHIVLVTFGYAGSSTGFFSELWDLILNAPGMLLATAATVLFTAVVITSIRAARKRLRYESWHLLHLYAYLGVGLAIPHQLWTGTEFTSSPLSTTYWWMLYVAAAGATLIFRLGIPIYRSTHHKLEVSSVTKEASGVFTVTMRGQHLDQLRVHAGQFFLWRFMSGPGWTRAHPYSLSSAPNGKQLRITVKNLGDDSAKIGELRPGTRVLFEGPLGILTGESYRGGQVALFGCGVGITPLKALLEELPYAHGQATLVYRVRSQAEAIFRSELQHLADQRGVRVIYVPGPRAGHGSWLPVGAADRGEVTALNQLIPDLRNHDVYICGPDAWTTAVRDCALQLHTPAEHIHYERFTW